MKPGRKQMAVLAAAVTALALTGCGTPSETKASGEASAAPVTQGQPADSGSEPVANPEDVAVDSDKLVFWSMFSGGDGEFMDQMIGDYNGTQAAKQIQPIMLDWGEYYTKLQTAVASGKGPDIGASHASSLPQLVADGVVQPITPYLEEVGFNLGEHFSEASIDAVTFDGEVYAMPLDTHAEIISYNKEFLDRAGIELDADGQVPIQSADDFYEVCDKIKAVLKDGETVISIGNKGDEPYRVWWAVYFQMGGTPLVNEARDGVTLDKETAVKAAEFMKGLYDRGYVLEGIDDHQKFFQSGKAGMGINGTWSTGAYEQTENLDFIPTSFPRLFDNQACWADSHTFILPVKKARSEEDSKHAVNFMIHAVTDGGIIWAGSGQIPASKDALESETYLQMPFRSNYKSEVDLAVLPTKISTFNAMKKGMIDSLDMLWAGKLDAAGAIDMLCDELEANLP